MSFHKREWLNPLGVFANSTITAYHGDNTYFDVELKKEVTYTETQLRISDCNNSIRFHEVNNDRKEFINKMRLIEKVAKEFADYLESLEPNK